MTTKKTKTEREIEKAVRLLERHGYKVTPPEHDVLIDVAELNRRKLEARKGGFVEQLRPYLNTYGREMLNSFFNYWTEPNRTFTKMRFEMQPTWDLKLRLETWNRNNKRRNGTDYKEQQRQQRLRDSADLFAKYTGAGSAAAGGDDEK